MENIEFYVIKDTLACDVMPPRWDYDVEILTARDFHRICPMIFQRFRILRIASQRYLRGLPDAPNTIYRLTLENLESLTYLSRSMPALQELELAACPAMDSIDCDMPLLKILDLNDMDLRYLPTGLTNLRQLFMRSSDLVTSIPSDMRNLTDLVLRDCFRIERIPDGLERLENLEVENCPLLESLGGGLRNLEYLEIRSADRLKAIPEDLTKLHWFKMEDCASVKFVHEFYCKNIRIKNCPNLISIGFRAENLEAMYVTKCDALQVIPTFAQNLRVLELTDCAMISDVRSYPKLRTLWLTNLMSFNRFVGDFESLKILGMVGCYRVDSFPKNLDALESINVDNCASLSSIPSDVDSGAVVHVFNCGNFIGLHPRVSKLRALSVVNCPKFETLYGVLELSDYLMITDCDAFRGFSLPVSVRGEATFVRCPSLTRFTETDFAAHRLNLTELDNLRGVGATVKVMRIDAVNCDELRSSLVGVDPPEGITVEDCPKFNDSLCGRLIDVEDLMGGRLRSEMGEEVRMFMNKLIPALQGQAERYGAEAVNVIIDRVMEILRSLNDADEHIKGAVRAYMLDSVTSCHDRPIWAVNQVHVLFLIQRARGDRSKLRILGERILRLELLHRCVRKYISCMAKGGCEVVDEVTIYLIFEIRLRERLQLPLCATKMMFHTMYKVTDEELEMTGDIILRESVETFETWLQTWPEWQRFQREQQARRVDLETLPETVVESDGAARVNLCGEEASDFVLLRGRVWSLADVLKHWTETGKCIQILVQVVMLVVVARC